jgi:hypothetical protein
MFFTVVWMRLQGGYRHTQASLLTDEEWNII